MGLTKTDLEASRSENKETQLRALFDVLVKPEMKSSWERQWKDWFTTTDTVIDKRTPGKMKGILINPRIVFEFTHNLR